MKTRLTIILLVTAVCLRAQTAPDTKTLTDALKLRDDLADAIFHGSEKPEAALILLKKEKSPTGLNLDADVDFAYAAIDIGQRLIAADRPAEAEKFFLEAEKSLDLVVKKSPDSQARDKAQYLQKLALIRGNYLNKAGQAKQDMEQAIALQPEDKDLKRAKDVLNSSNAEAGKAAKGN